MKCNFQLFLLFTLVGLFSCVMPESNSDVTIAESEIPTEVIVHAPRELNTLFPIFSKTAGEKYISNNIFFYLIIGDPKTLENVPIIVKSVPVVEDFEEGLAITYEIRPEAEWDNGTPILASDFDFTLKMIANPRVDTPVLRSFLDFIIGFKYYPDNPRKFTLYTKDKYFQAIDASSYFIFPEYVYDPKGLMKGFKLEDLKNADKLEDLNKNAKINEYADFINAPEKGKDINFLVGGGPYKVTSWKTGQEVVLEKKEDWWGDQLIAEIPQIAAYPKKLIYKIILDETVAVTAAKGGEIDVLSEVSPRDFVELQKDEAFSKKYNFHSPIATRYDYIGFNFQKEKLKDVRVRKALAHLANISEIIKVSYNDLATPTIGPFHPSKDYYYKELKTEYEPEKAMELLDEAGWKDTDNDGVRDKIINNKKVDLSLDLVYNINNDITKNTVLIFQEAVERVGVKIELKGSEYRTTVQNALNRNFDLVLLSWQNSIYLDDPKAVWHSDSDVPGGYNFLGFRNDEIDVLINKIRFSNDKKARNKMYKRFQEILYKEQPQIFLACPKERIIISNKYDNAESSLIRPGYFERYFTLKK